LEKFIDFYKLVKFILEILKDKTLTTTTTQFASFGHPRYPAQGMGVFKLPSNGQGGMEGGSMDGGDRWGSSSTLEGMTTGSWSS
jgi:hypothetical protein